MVYMCTVENMYYSMNEVLAIYFLFIPIIPFVLLRWLPQLWGIDTPTPAERRNLDAGNLLLRDGASNIDDECSSLLPES